MGAGEPGDHCKSGSACGQETLRRACEHLGGLRADPGGTNLLAALGWALAQPLHHGYPRQLFLFTGTAAGSASRILRLVRRQASTVRYGTRTAAGLSVLHIPCAIPTDFSSCSLKSHSHLPQGCPSPITSLSPLAPLFLGCPSPACGQGSTLAVRHPCPSLLKGSPLGLPAPSPSPAMTFHALALLQMLQLRHGPAGVPAAAEGHGQGEPGPC